MEKYLLYDYFSAPGLLHQMARLETHLAEGLFLGRTVVLPELQLHDLHNHGVRLSGASWEDFIDLRQLLGGVRVIFEKDCSPRLLERVCNVPADMPPRSLMTEFGNSQAIRRSFPISSGDGLWDFYWLLPEIPTQYHLNSISQLCTNPATTIKEAASSVVSELGDYAAVHVRRGDKIGRSQYPFLNAFTSATRIRLSLMTRKFPAAKSVYLLTNEPCSKHFEALERNYNIRRPDEFPQLAELAKISNYHLFLAEIYIFIHAKDKIGTFLPQGSFQKRSFHPCPDYPICTRRSLAPYPIQGFRGSRWRRYADFFLITGGLLFSCRRDSESD